MILIIEFFAWINLLHLFICELLITATELSKNIGKAPQLVVGGSQIAMLAFFAQQLAVTEDTNIVFLLAVN